MIGTNEHLRDLSRTVARLDPDLVYFARKCRDIEAGLAVKGQTRHALARRGLLAGAWSRELTADGCALARALPYMVAEGS